MARNQSTAIFAVALLLFAAATPPALAQAPPPLPDVGPFLPTIGSLLSSITIKGSLCCINSNTVNGVPCCDLVGICPGDFPLAGVPTTLFCFIGGASYNVSQGITDSNGNISLTVANSASRQLGPVAAIVGRYLPCTIGVRIPAGIFCKSTFFANILDLGVPFITGLHLGDNGIHRIATVMDSQAGAPV